MYYIFLEMCARIQEPLGEIRAMEEGSLLQGTITTKSLRIQQYHRHILHSSSCCIDLYILPSFFRICY